MIVAGLGCHSACAAEELIALLQQAMAVAGVEVTLIATPGHRATLPAIRGTAAALEMSVQVVDHAALAAQQARCVTHSETVRRATGLGSVAEAAALAAAGPRSRLLLPRIASARATCALAVSGE